MRERKMREIDRKMEEQKNGKESVGGCVRRITSIKAATADRTQALLISPP